MAKLSNTASANQAAFGQLGSAFTDTDANTIHAPEGMAIIAITFLADAVLDSLVAEDPERTINTAQAANSKGLFTRVVATATGTTNIIEFDDTNAASGVAIGDEVYDSDGTLHGTVTELDPNSDNTSEIKISASVAITNDEVLSFVRPGFSSGGRGVGGLQIADGSSGNSFPRGLTIYGRWLSVSLDTNQPQGGLIAYFG